MSFTQEPARAGSTTTMCLVMLSLLPVFGCKGANDDADHAHEAGDHDEEQIGTPSGATCPDGGAPDGGALSYESFGKPFMDEYCVKCHSTELKGKARMGAPAGHDFNVLAGILGVADHVDQYAASGPDSTNTNMPPAGQKQPSIAERARLGEWLACELGKLE